MKRFLVSLLAVTLIAGLCACAAPTVQALPSPTAAIPAPTGTAAPTPENTTAPENTADGEIDLLTYDDLPGGVPCTNTCGHANMTLVLPAGWKGALIPPDDAGAFGIDFWREDSSENILKLRYRPEQIGLCGTGLESEEAVYGTLTASRLRYTDLSHWTLWIFRDTPGEYTLETDAPNNWIDSHAGELDAILGSLVLGEGVIPRSEAEAVARTVYTGEDGSMHVSFDARSGLYTFRFWPLYGSYDKAEVVAVDFLGKIAEK